MKILKKVLLVVLIIAVFLWVGIYFWPQGPLRPIWEKISKQSPDNLNVLSGRAPATSTAIVSESVFSPVTIKAYELDEDGGLVQRNGNYAGMVVGKSGLILILSNPLLHQLGTSKEIVGLSVCPENDVSDCPYQAALVIDDQVLNLALLQAIAVPGAGQEKEWPAMLPADAVSKLAPWGQASSTVATSTSADFNAWNEAGAVWVRAHLRSQPQSLPLAGPMNGFLKKQEILRQSDVFIDSRIGFSITKPTSWKWYFESENRFSVFDNSSNSSLGINFYKFPYDASLEDIRLLAKHWAWETSNESTVKVAGRDSLKMQLSASNPAESTVNYFVPIGKYVVNFGFIASSTPEQLASYEKVINSFK
jgi:hypothetical protein